MDTLMKRSLVVIATILCACNALADTAVEVVLVEHLPDEDRGWCIDAAGHQQNAIMEGGVHAHTCYSYEGSIAVDQGFSAESIAEGVFELVAFDHCMSMSIREPDSWIALTPCDGRIEQQFEMTDDGLIVSKAAPELCITLGLDLVYGGGGNPIHKIRTATLDTCSDEKAKYQRWRYRDHRDW
jgi:hypothetical protein